MCGVQHAEQIEDCANTVIERETTTRYMSALSLLDEESNALWATLCDPHWKTLWRTRERKSLHQEKTSPRLALGLSKHECGVGVGAHCSENRG